MEENGTHILSSNIADKTHWLRTRTNIYLITHIFINFLGYVVEGYTAGDYIVGGYTVGHYMFVKQR